MRPSRTRIGRRRGQWIYSRAGLPWQDKPKRPDRMDFSETVENDPFVNAGKALSMVSIRARPAGHAGFREVPVLGGLCMTARVCDARR